MSYISSLSNVRITRIFFDSWLFYEAFVLFGLFLILNTFKSLVKIWKEGLLKELGTVTRTRGSLWNTSTHRSCNACLKKIAGTGVVVTVENNMNFLMFLIRWYFFFHFLLINGICRKFLLLSWKCSDLTDSEGREKQTHHKWN